MKTIFLIGLLIAAAYAVPVKERVAQIEKNMTHLWDMVHDMEEHHGGGVHIHFQTNDPEGGDRHESAHLKTDENDAHVYLHMNMDNHFDDHFNDFEVTEHSEMDHDDHGHHDADHMEHGDGDHMEHGDGHHMEHGDSKDHKDKHVHHHHYHHHHHHHGDMLEAHCDLAPNNADEFFNGHIHLKQIKKDVLSVHVDFDCPSGLDAGANLGLHVHEGSDLSMGCDSLGGHYNPHGVEHGPRTGTPDTRHAGDWGNVVCDSKNEVDQEFQDHVAQLTGPNSIMNRSIVLHMGTDDLGLGKSRKSKKSGAAGGRLACCIITKAMH